MSDAFRALHESYYSGGTDGYVDSEGGWITRFWGVNTGNVSYVLNHEWVSGTKTYIQDGDELALYVYNVFVNYADLYTWFDCKFYTGYANTEYSFTVNGLNVMNSSEMSAATASPTGATVRVYDKDGREYSEMATTTDEKGEFTLTFPEDGKYIIEVSGTCDYTCAGYGDSSGLTYKEATVVPSRCEIIIGEEEGMLGDVNEDGKVTNGDVVLLLNKVTAGEAVDLAIGDINGDGQITNGDVVLLLNKVTAGEI